MRLLPTAAAVILFAAPTLSSANKPPVVVTKSDDRLTITIGGKLFSHYIFKGGPRPYFYPVIGPNGETLTRHFPMKDGVEGEARDHPHHKSIWFTHGEVNGHNFWADGHDLMVHKDFATAETNKEGDAVITQNLVWTTKDGKPVCDEERTVVVTPLGDGEVYMDWTITIKAAHGDVVFGDTKEGGMAIRVAPTMRAKGGVAKGTLINSEGQTATEAWGKRALWCDYNGPDASGKIAGIAIFDHPENLRHPTTWHARDYGLLTANPFGVSYFEKKPKGTGDHTIKKGETMTLRYRLYIHKGDEKEAKVAEHCEKYGK